MIGINIYWKKRDFEINENIRLCLKWKCYALAASNNESFDFLVFS